MIETSEYYTIAAASEGEYKEKGSKFIAYAYPVEDEEEIKTHIENLKKKHHKARHHCYAYLLGAEKNKYRANDDGEPSNSAGKPILGQIQAKNLTNVLVVVVRYFGGVKLGVGGLMNAYKKATEDALNHATVIKKKVLTNVNITCNFNQLSFVRNIINRIQGQIVKEQYDDKSCKFVIAFPVDETEKLQKLMETRPDVEYRFLSNDN